MMVYSSRVNSFKYPTEELANDPLSAIIYSRVNYNDKNFIGIVSGETGIGKSVSVIAWALKLDITSTGLPRWYTVSKTGEIILPKLCFTPEEFVNLIQSGKLKKGDVIIWDESGVGIGTTEWQSKRLRFINYILQTFRFKNLILLLTVPDKESIAKFARRLAHAQIVVKECDNDEYNKNLRVMKFYWVSKNRVTGEERLSKIVYFDRETDEIKKIDNYYIKKPPKEIIEAYENMKGKYTSNMYDSFKKSLNYMNEKLGENKTYTIDEAVEYIKNNKEIFFDPKTKIFNKDIISSKLNFDNKTAEKLKNILNTMYRQDKL